MADADRDLQAAIAVTRFGLGARPGEIAAARPDPRAWLKAQIRREGADEPQGPNGGPLPSMRQTFAAFADYQNDVRDLRLAAAAGPAAGAAADQAMGTERAQSVATDVQRRRQQAALPLRQMTGDEMLARVQLATATPAGFRERWALFWGNHFTVAIKSLRTTAGVGPFEREAVRPYVFGRFGDMLAATSRHPGMLMYLDQVRSAGPGSAAGQRRRIGLNENLAREILELHTVGADAGYSQADVTEFARALTGWSMGGADAGPDMGAYIYRIGMHEPGERRVMGKTYRPGGDDQASAILADLAVHPATARHIATKLATHFVADTPPPGLVSRLEGAWVRTRGDLAAVAEALIDAPEAWAPPPAKFKTPYEFVVSGYRAAGATPRVAAQEVTNPLQALGQRPFSAPQPNGWSDQASEWAAPSAMVKRLGWARGFAHRYAPQDGAPADTARAVLGARLSPKTAEAMTRAESRADAFALLLMSPEFQRR